MVLTVLRRLPRGIGAKWRSVGLDLALMSTANNFCGVEVWRGGLGGAYRLPTLSSVGASRAPPCCRFHTPLIEPDVRICRIRLSEKTHAMAVAIACDAVCNF
jgi:hypothetical protein